MIPFTYSAFMSAVLKCTSRSAILHELRRPIVGSEYLRVNALLEKFDIPLTYLSRKSKEPRIVPTPELLVANSKHSRALIKKVVLRYNLLPYVCVECGLTDEWNGKKLTLRLDHRNGVHNDHSLENLRFLCPNCDSQSDTYCGRNKEPSEPKRRRTNVPCECGRLKTKRSGRCLTCFNNLPRVRKIQWPDNDTLAAMVQKMTLVKVAKMLGVSDTAVKHHCQRQNISRKRQD